MLDTLIRGASVMTPDGERPLDVGLRDGRIAALIPPGGEASAGRVIDAAGKHLLPGAVDIHFHVRAPAHPERGTVESETRAAAAGGVTTLFEMPISKPCCATPEIVRARREHFSTRAYVNFGLYGAPGRLNPAEIAGMVDEGVIGFKIFTTAAPPGRDDEFVGLSLPDPHEQHEALRLVAETGRVTVVHAETESLVAAAMEREIAASRRDAAAHGASRPAIAEANAIAGILSLAQGTGAPVHIAHVSSKAGADILRAFQGLGIDASGETCPHYLLFTDDDVARHGVFAKINPPVRTAADRDALWAAIADGTLTSVTTDHAPFSLAEKERVRGDMLAAPPGAPGVEQLLLSMLDAAAAGRITLRQAVDLVSANGARRFGVYPRKGAIVEGADADLVIVDLARGTTVDRSRGHSAAAPCDRLYDGRTFRARIERTLVAGETVFDGERIVGRPGHGAFLRPA